MNRRERILAAAVGALVVLFAINVGFKRIHSQFTARTDRIAQLQSDLKSKELSIARGQVAQRTLSACSERSLPSSAQWANTRYRAWLHECLEQAGIHEANVTYLRGTPFKNYYELHRFNASCEATLPQVVDLLYRFYAVDILHRLQHAKLIPQENTNLLACNFTVEAISMPDVEKDRPLPTQKSQRLAFDNVQAYQDAIVGRNFYGRGNRPPKFASSETQHGFLGRPLDVTLRAEDPDKNAVQFRLDKSDLEGLRVDPQSGRIQWTPDRKGQFEIQVSAIDDGIPAKEVSQTIRLEITDPPPERVRNTRPAFNEAKYTFVTGIVEINGRREVWMTVRSEGKLLCLHEGDTFRVGSFQGKIAKIHPRHVEIESPDGRWSVRYGQSLGDGQELEGGTDVAATGG